MPYEPLPQTTIPTPQPTPSLPPRTATANEVRAFLTETLITKYNFADENLAEAATENWRVGRGAELHDASLEYFQQLFGVEVGFCLHRSVGEEKKKVNVRSPEGFFYGIFGLCIWIFGAWLVWTLVKIVFLG
ncbi:hypothetical protein BJX64DRAFT_252693 [Aspergillus heterothallicus]